MNRPSHPALLSLALHFTVARPARSLGPGRSRPDFVRPIGRGRLLALSPLASAAPAQPATAMPGRRSSKIPLILGGGCLGGLLLCLVAGAIVYLSGALAGPSVKADAFAAFAPDGSRIAFSSRRKGNEDIFDMNANGTNLRQLTSDRLALLAPGINNYADYAPAWSPDGKQIAFTTARNNAALSYVEWDVYVMNADGSNPHRFMSRAAEPAWSPDDQWIAYASTGRYTDIYTSPAGGGSGGGAVTQFGNAAVASPDWSPDGKRIVFAKNGSGSDVSEIYVVGADGSGLTQLTTLNARSAEPDWSPDGRKIAFHSNYRGSANIFTMNPDGTELANLTNYLGDNSSPAWSPDSRRIIFSSSRQGEGQLLLFVMGADGSNVVQLTK